MRDPHYDYFCRNGRWPRTGWDPDETPHEKRPCLLDTRKSIRESPRSRCDVYGYVATWGCPPHDRNVMLEPGMFSDFLKTSADVELIVNHDWARGILAHRSEGNLFLAEDNKGLYFEAKFPDTALGRQIRSLFNENQNLGCSFHPMVHDEKFIDGVTLYRRASLRDVSLMTPDRPCAIGASRAWMVRERHNPPVYLYGNGPRKKGCVYL
jgi:HK97 family phage prohead protease